MREDSSLNGITLYQNGLGIDDKLRSKNGTTIRYFLTDHLGSTEALTDASGTITSSTSYDSFGNAIPKQAAGSAASGAGNAATSIPTSYQYTGREYDADTGLYYYRNRWYDSETGRFISEDPIGFAGGDINLYGYVGNNPHGYIDPFGFWRCSSNDPPGSSGWWDLVQGALDVAGLAPVVGLPADVLNAGISAARGNYTDAALSMAAAVPLAGTVAGAAKLAGKASRALRLKGTPKFGDKVYRVWGDGAKAGGRFWSRTDPRTVKNYRDVAGLPNQNSGRFVTEGILTSTKGVKQNYAAPLHGNKGGLDELVVPNPNKQVRIKRVSGVNPEF